MKLRQMMLSHRMVSLFVVTIGIAIVIFSSSTLAVKGCAKSYVLLHIVPDKQECIISIQMWNLNQSSVTMCFPALKRWSAAGGLYKLEVLSPEVKETEEGFLVPVKDGLLNFTYKLWMPFKENVQRSPWMGSKHYGFKPYGVHRNFIYLKGFVFARPLNEDLAQNLPLTLKVEAVSYTHLTLPTTERV